MVHGVMEIAKRREKQEQQNKPCAKTNSERAKKRSDAIGGGDGMKTNMCAHERRRSKTRYQIERKEARLSRKACRDMANRSNEKQSPTLQSEFIIGSEKVKSGTKNQQSLLYFANIPVALIGLA